jgi:hypothetical protein
MRVPRQIAPTFSLWKGKGLQKGGHLTVSIASETNISLE